MQNPSTCPICASVNIAGYAPKFGYEVFRCESCGVQWLNPQPDDQTLERIYNEHYFLGSEDGQDMTQVWEMKRATARVYLDQLAAATGKRRGRMLEVGCGTGDFLVEAQRDGYEVEGVEVSAHAVETANTKLGAALVRQGILEDFPVECGGFDVAAMFDLVEHVRQPGVFLKQVHQLLKPGGVAFIVTPSLDSWSAKLLGKNWMEYKLEHLWYFNRRAIQIALEGAGFKNISTAPNYKVLSFDYINRHFQRFTVPALTPLLGALRKATPEALAKRPVKLVASGMAVFAEK